MRTARVRLAPPGEGLHPADSRIAAHHEIRREAIDHVTGLEDGTAVVLCRLRGNRSAMRDILDSESGVLGFNITDGNGTAYTQVHFTLTETAAALLELRRKHEIIVRTPIRWLSDGRLAVSLVGDDATLQSTIAEIPESVEVELAEIGEYNPESERPAELLTDRQLEVLDAALDVGYYSEPRQGTQADVADAVGLAPATVGEHLRRIEEKVFRALRE